MSQEQILKLLSRRIKPMSSKQISDRLKLSPATTMKNLSKLREQQLVKWNKLTRKTGNYLTYSI